MTDFDKYFPKLASLLALIVKGGVWGRECDVQEKSSRYTKPKEQVSSQISAARHQVDGLFIPKQKLVTLIETSYGANQAVSNKIIHIIFGF